MNSKKNGEILKAYFKSIGKTQEDIAAELGVTHPYVNALLNGKPFGKKQAAKWEILFGISAYWLITGKGAMLTDGTTPQFDDNITNEVLFPQEDTIPSGDFPTAEPTDGQMVPTNIPAWLPTSDDVESVAAEEVPFITKPVIESREVDIRQFIEEGKAKMIIPQGLIEQKVDYARKIYSDAMAPDIREGDIILCSFLPDTSYLVDGDIYALDTTKYGCVIRDIEHNGEEIILHARNHKHPDLIVKQTEILSVAVPMQLIRSTFSQRTDYEQIIKDKDDRIDLLVNREREHIIQTGKHLEHIDRLLEQIDRASNQQGQYLEQIDRVTAQQGKLIEALVNKQDK